VMSRDVIMVVFKTTSIQIYKINNMNWSNRHISQNLVFSLQIKVENFKKKCRKYFLVSTLPYIQWQANLAMSHTRFSKGVRKWINLNNNASLVYLILASRNRIWMLSLISI